MFYSFSLPGFRCIDGSLLLVPLLPSKGRNSDSRILLSKVFPIIVIHIFHKTNPFFEQLSYLIDLFYYTMDFIAKQVFFLFFAIHLPPVEEGEFFLYIILKKLLWQPKELRLIISWQLYSYCSRPSQKHFIHTKRRSSFNFTF